MENTPGTLIRQWRTERGLTQAKLAALAGVDVATLQRWESGKVKPQAAAYILVLQALNTSEKESQKALAVLDRRISNQSQTTEDGMLQMPHLCDLLQAMRKRRRLSLSQAALRLRVSKATLSRYENGVIAPDRERLPDIFSLYHALPEERYVLTDHRFLLTEPYASTPVSPEILENRLDALHQRLYEHNLFAGDLCFLALETQLVPLANHSRRALHLLLSCWSIHAEWLLWQGRVLEIEEYAHRVFEIGHSYHMQDEAHQARAVEMMARFFAQYPNRGQPKRALSLFERRIDLPANKLRVSTLYRDMAEMAGNAGQPERALHYLEISRREAWKQSDHGQFLLADVIEARIRIEMGRADQGLALLTRLPMADPGLQTLIMLLQSEALLALGQHTEAERGLNQFYSYIEQYDLSGHRWKGKTIARRLEMAK